MMMMIHDDDDGRVRFISESEQMTYGEHTEASTFSSMAFLARSMASLGPCNEISRSTSDGWN